VLDSYRELLDELAATPTQLREMASRAGSPRPGEPDAATILAQLAASEQAYFAQLNTLLNEVNPVLRSSEAAVNARVDELAGQSWQENLDAFNAVRGETISLLMGMTLNDWEKSGGHPESGSISIADLIEQMADHDAEQIRQLKALSR
jgi:hypothetical protein